MKAKTTTMTKKLMILPMIILMLFMITACESASPGTRDEDLSDSIDIGSGSTAFTFIMIDGEENVTSWNVKTNESTVGDALLEVGLIEGTVSDFGLMVSHVNGIRADFNEDSAWWAFYIDDEMAMAGVDATEIEEGVIYAFIYSPA